ncbi:MAG: HlyD family efflux transporter periplasmic adaptor subunit [Candidatus Saccharimonadales bacterium]
MLKRDKLQYEFLPDALEIIETPPSPWGKAIVWGIIGILLFATLWATFGRVDVIAMARGKVIPNGDVKIVQSNVSGRVIDIKVKDGQKVIKGQELLSLDSSLKNTDLRSLNRDYAVASLELDILRYGFVTDRTSQALQDGNVSEETQQDVKSAIWAKSSSYNSKEQSLTQVLNQANTQLRTEQDTLQRLQDNLASQTAGAPGYTTAQAQVDAQKSQVEQAKSVVAQSKANLASAQGDSNAAISSLIVEQDKKVADLESQLEKAKVGMQLQTLTAPVDGTVSNLAIHTVGAVVTPAQALLTVVPTGTLLIVDASIENKDIGYVTVGQQAVLKFDAFSFQQYGTIPAEVTAISPDSIENKDRTAALYKANLSFIKKIMRVNNRDVPITPGMTLTVEVKTGKRRIIQFFFDPLIKKSDESLKVR